jgi:mono/diheme cytochrome c family protein
MVVREVVLMNMTRWLLPIAFCYLMLSDVSPVIGAELVIDVGSRKTLTTEELLNRPDVRTIQIPADAVYKRTMTYRAVPLRAVLGVDHLPAGQELQIKATDGFVTNLPAKLIFSPSRKGAEPWLAIEPSDKPWPPAPKGAVIGPFYVVWSNPAASGILSEQWPYNVEAIGTVAESAVRWPQLAVGEDVAAASPVRAGQALFVTQCMPCHRMSGAGDSTLGPDLNLPHNPTEYFQPWALKAFIRNPASVRAWPDMKMHGFDKAAMSDPDIDAIIAYLGYMSMRPH